ncbi:Hypothetical protein GbCGDNIH4_2031 [Granulibacter bethesdensis CGDNIH4]|nr:Hypothetical protein GbCGDNIH4_2031 [Granulibacter bethesdensis CGDNIH4]
MRVVTIFPDMRCVLTFLLTVLIACSLPLQVRAMEAAHVMNVSMADVAAADDDVMAAPLTIGQHHAPCHGHPAAPSCDGVVCCMGAMVPDAPGLADSVRVRLVRFVASIPYHGYGASPTPEPFPPRSGRFIPA